MKSLQRDVMHEPASALDGGPDGLNILNLIIENWLQTLLPKGLLALETSSAAQRKTLRQKLEGVRSGHIYEFGPHLFFEVDG